MLDFAEIYHFDLSPAFMREHSWAAMQLLLIGLLSRESRLQRVLRPVDPKTGEPKT